MIRRANINDINDIKLLLEQVKQVHVLIRPDIFKNGTIKYTDEELEKEILDPNNVIFVYEKDSKVVGHAFCKILDYSSSFNQVSRIDLYIDDICVDNNYRRLGIGKDLFEEIKRFAKENGIKNINLTVWEGNDSAKRFYESLGMETRYTSLEIKL